MKNKKIRHKVRKNGLRAKKIIAKKRPLHKKLLLHPFTVFVLLCIGVFMVCVTIKSFAGSYSVTAKVPAPPITEPATITQPLDQARFSSIPINVSGTCPDNSYVKLYRNNVFSGVALCLDNTYQISTDLFSGTNTLVARVFNLTDDEGPVSGSITVYYDKPTPTPTPAPTTTPTPTPTVLNIPSQQSNKADTTNEMIIKSNYTYHKYVTNKTITWTIGLVGGIAPYAAHVDWGDGQSSDYVRQNNSDFTISHTYAKNSKSNYVVKIKVTDINGKVANLQLAVALGVINQPTSATNTNNKITSGISSILQNKTLLAFIWPSYLIVLLMAISFYLGEREEYKILSSKRRLSTHRRTRTS